MTQDASYGHEWRTGHGPLPQRIGRWRVLSLVSEERYGVKVFKGVDAQGEAEVAIKVYEAPLASFAESVWAVLLEEDEKRVLRAEGEALAQLAHPNIVRLVEHGTDPEYGPFLALEWVDGPTLRAHLDAMPQRRLPLDQALEITRDLLSALSAIHQKGFLHLDVTPANVLLDSARRAKLADFDVLAEHSLGLLHPGRGTPGYMAPEQQDPARFHLLGPSADLYAVGVILAETLTGAAPRRTDDARQALSGLPEPVVQAVQKALDDDPDKRFPSATEMARALRLA